MKRFRGFVRVNLLPVCTLPAVSLNLRLDTGELVVGARPLVLPAGNLLESGSTIDSVVGLLNLLPVCLFDVRPVSGKLAPFVRPGRVV